MKIAVSQADLLPAIQSVSRSVGVRATLPVLGNLLLSTQNNQLKLAATNLEIGTIKLVPAKVAEEGEITIPAKTFGEIVHSLGSGDLALETKGDILAVTSGKFDAQINGIAATEFPIIPTSTENSIVFGKEVIKDYGKIMFAASSDGGRPVLTGILTESHQGKLDLVATDGFRLAHRQVSLPDQKANFKTIIPKRTLEELLRLLDEDPGEENVVSLSFSTNKNQIVFTIGLTTLSSRLIEGQYPSWEKIIPQDHSTRVILERSSLSQAIKLASVFATNETNVVTLDVAGDKLTISSETKELGAQTNELDCQVEGAPLKIAFSARFLSDAISVISSESLTMEFSSPLAPALIKPVGMEGLEYIVMPVRQT